MGASQSGEPTPNASEYKSTQGIPQDAQQWQQANAELAANVRNADEGGCGITSHLRQFLLQRDSDRNCGERNCGLTECSHHCHSEEGCHQWAPEHQYRFEADDVPFELSGQACIDRNRDSFNPRMLLPLQEGKHEIFIASAPAQRRLPAQRSEQQDASASDEAPNFPAQALSLSARSIRLLQHVCGSLGSAYQYEELQSGTPRTVMKICKSRLHRPLSALEDLNRLVAMKVKSGAVAKVLRHQADQNNCYLVFEDIAQIPCIASRLKAPSHTTGSRPLSEQDIAILAAKVLKILNDLHSEGCAAGVLLPETIFCSIEGGTKPEHSPWGNLRLLALPRVAEATGSSSKLRFFMAPELLRCEIQASERMPTFDPAADIWSLGVLVYLLLCGQYPHASVKSSEASTEEVLQRGQWRFEPREDWVSISSRAKQFLKDGLLQPNPKMRATAAEALSHEWITGWQWMTEGGVQDVPLGHGFRIALNASAPDGGSSKKPMLKTSPTSPVSIPANTS